MRRETECLSMYSLISMRIIIFSLSNSMAANCKVNKDIFII